MELALSAVLFAVDAVELALSAVDFAVWAVVFAFVADCNASRAAVSAAAEYWYEESNCTFVYTNAPES